MDNEKLRATIDISKASMVNEVKLGATVKVIVTGKVIGLTGPSESLYAGIDIKGKKPKEEKHLSPGNLRIELQSFDVESVGEFEDPDEDD